MAEIITERRNRHFSLAHVSAGRHSAEVLNDRFRQAHVKQDRFFLRWFCFHAQKIYTAFVINSRQFLLFVLQIKINRLHLLYVALQSAQ